MRKAGWTIRGMFCFATVYFASFTFLSAAQPQTGRAGRADLKVTVGYADILRLKSPLPQKGVEAEDEASEFMPLNRPLPPGAVLGRELFSRIPPQQAQAVLVSPPPAVSFAALGDNNTVIPPDVHGAAGPNHLMVTLNSQVRIQNRTGGVLSTVSLNSFWASLGNPSCFDPKILYDPFQNRWMFTAVSNSRSAASSVLMGVSQTSDPTGVWNLYRIDADPANVAWADYPSFGFNKNWIVVQINMFAVSNNAFIRSNIYAFDKADLYAGGAGLFTLFFDTTGGFAQTPAITYDTTVSTMYLLEDWFGNSGGMGILRLSTITGAVGAETYTPGVVFPSVADPWEDIGSTGFADFAPQSGSAQKIMNNDARLQNTVYRNGSLWCAHTVFLPAGSGTHSSVQWWKLTPAGGILDRGRIDDPSGNVFYAFPSIAVNKNNDALLGFSRFSAAQFAGGNYAFRAASDAAGTFRIDTVLKAGEAVYFKTFSGTRNRWGDYSGTVADPVNDLDFWTIQEYAAAQVAGSSRWGTWWGKIVPPAVSPCLLDSIKPSITCPANIVKSNDPGQCAATATFAASASDSCSSVSLVCTPSSGSSFPVGVTNVTCVATDSAGNKDSCTFSVTVSDTSKPAGACPANVVKSNDPGQCGAAVAYSANASDNCPGATLACLPPSGSSFPVGITNVKCTATDAAGNKDSCLFSVSVSDTSKPAATCPANVVKSNDPGQCTAAVAYAAGAADNCPGVSLFCTPPSGSAFPVGATQVGCTATDAAGNRDSCSFQVAVNDVEKPAVACPADLAVFRSPAICDSVPVTYSATASDNCSGVLPVCNPPSGSGFPLGATTVTCVAVDAGGNGDTCAFNVTVYKGDMDGSGSLTSADAVMMLNCVFLGVGTCNLCFTDLNCDGVLTSADAVMELNAVFLGVLFSCSP